MPILAQIPYLYPSAWDGTSGQDAGYDAALAYAQGGVLPTGAPYERYTGYYGEYAGSSSYSTDTGIIVLPLCKPDTAGGPYYRLAQVHATVGIRTQTWSAAKRQTPPLVPAMADTPSGDKFLSGSMSLANPVRLDQGYLGHAAQGEFRYVQGGAPVLNDITGAVVCPTYAPRDRTSVYETNRPPAMSVGYDEALIAWAFSVDFLQYLLNLNYYPGVNDPSIIYGAANAAAVALAAGSTALPNFNDLTYVDFSPHYRPYYLADGLIM